MGKGGFYKGVILGAATAVVVLVGTTALASVTAVGGPFLIGQTNDGAASTSLLQSAPTTGAALRVLNTATTGSPYGIIGRTYGPSAAVRGYNSSTGPGVEAVSANGAGVTATASSGTGVTATSSTGTGVAATSSSGAGISATSTSGPGVYATSSSGVGVTALSSISNAITAVTAGNHKSGIYGQHVGGVDGFGGNFKTALGNGVHAESAGGGAGLEAVGTNNAYALKATSANQTAIAADATSGGSAMTVVQHGGGDGLRTSALGGGWAAYLDGNAKVTGNLAVNGNISGHDLGQTLWAEVRADGTLIRGRGAVSSSREDTGEYWIVFDRSVDLCGVVANTVIIPGGGDWGTFEAASATVGAGAAGHEGQAAVAIRSHLGTLSDARFTLVVIC